MSTAAARELAPPWVRPRGPLILVGLLAAFDLALLAVAFARAGDVVRDGAGSVTNGANIAFSVGATLIAALALSFLRLPRSLRHELQIFALGAQALHALGHLARWYYLFRWFDDTLHIVLLLAAALLALRVAQSADLFPPRHATRARVAIVAFTAALALAGAWEIFEFLADELSGTREQDDLKDTMLDMIDGMIGGALAAAYAAARPVGRDRSHE